MQHDTGGGIHKSFYVMLLIPFLFLFFFYINYAQTAWFFQDDFTFLRSYQHDIHWEELFNFGSFGRFFSRNIYWYLGNSFFAPNAQFFYIFNLLTIFATSCLIFFVFRRRHDLFLSVAAALVYFTLPATIYAYVWISNSQHLLGHLFVLLFVYLYQILIKEKDSAWSAVVLVLVFLCGLSSNIFVTMVLSLVAWDLLTDPLQRRKKAPYIVLVSGCLLSLYFFIKLSKGAAGSYSTKISAAVLLENLEFYWQSSLMAFFWLFTVVAGTLISLRRRQYLNAWLFLASVAFFMPFAFFVQQRYLQYGLLSHLFFSLGLLALSGDLLKRRAPRVLAAFACLIVVAASCVSISKPIRFFMQQPWGAEQRQQVHFLKQYDLKHPQVKHYCFRPAGQEAAAPGAAQAPIPQAWWLVGFGGAFTQFVAADKTYALESPAEQCDARFEFDNGQLVPVK